MKPPALSEVEGPALSESKAPSPLPRLRLTVGDTWQRCSTPT